MIFAALGIWLGIAAVLWAAVEWKERRGPQNPFGGSPLEAVAFLWVYGGLGLVPVVLLLRRLFG